MENVLKKVFEHFRQIETFAVRSLEPYRYSFLVGKRITGCKRTVPHQLKNETPIKNPSLLLKKESTSFNLLCDYREKNCFVITLSLLSISVQELVNE